MYIYAFGLQFYDIISGSLCLFALCQTKPQLDTIQCEIIWDARAPHITGRTEDTQKKTDPQSKNQTAYVCARSRVRRDMHENTYRVLDQISLVALSLFIIFCDAVHF